jgi:hypothetical protein
LGSLAGLVRNELVEIGVGEHLALALLAVAHVNVLERARSDVAVEGLDRAPELCRSLACSQQATGHIGFALKAAGLTLLKEGEKFSERGIALKTQSFEFYDIVCVGHGAAPTAS